MGVAYAVKKGDMQLSDVDGDYRDKVKDLVDGMTLKQLKDFAETKHEGLPDVAENITPANIGGMGPVMLPTATVNGSGDVPAGQGDAEQEYKKKRRKMKHVKTFESFINESIVTENYEVIYSDGVSAMKKFRTEAQALDFMKKTIASNKKLRDIAVYKPGMHSTTQTELVVSFWGNGSYLDNVSKKDPELAAKKLEESVVNELNSDAAAILADEVNGELYTAKLKGKSASIKATTTTKTWDDETPVLKYLARGSSKSVKFELYQRPFKVVHDVAHDWFYFTDGRKWYGLHSDDGYYDPSDLPFEMTID